jgi:hypothetical protein
MAFHEFNFKAVKNMEFFYFKFKMLFEQFSVTKT